MILTCDMAVVRSSNVTSCGQVASLFYILVDPTTLRDVLCCRCDVHPYIHRRLYKDGIVHEFYEIDMEEAFIAEVMLS
jgi:hypothetical protein